MWPTVVFIGYDMTPNSTYYTVSIVSVDDYATLFLTTLSFMTITVLIMIVLNLVMMVKLLTRNTSTQFSKGERNLMTSSVTMFLIQALYLTILSSTLIGDGYTIYQQVAYNAVGEMMNMSNPFIVLACSKVVREHFVKYIPFCRSCKSGVSTTRVEVLGRK